MHSITAWSLSSKVRARPGDLSSQYLRGRTARRLLYLSVASCLWHGSKGPGSSTSSDNALNAGDHHVLAENPTGVLANEPQLPGQLNNLARYIACNAMVLVLPSCRLTKKIRAYIWHPSKYCAPCSYKEQMYNVPQININGYVVFSPPGTLKPIHYNYSDSTFYTPPGDFSSQSR